MKTISAALMTSVLCLSAATNAQAQAMLTWGVSAGMNRYSEANMKLSGPELGLHVRATDVFPVTRLELEGDVLMGKQNYSSPISGSMKGVDNLETRWRLLGEIVPDSGWRSGLAFHTLWNDLRGSTTVSSGKPHSGYLRSSEQFWLPLRWNPSNFWELELGRLITGKHSSALSQASSTYNDITNKQKSGSYFQVSVSMGLPNGDRLLPFVRYTHLSTSDIVTMAGDSWIEPNNHRLQTGVIWQFVSP